MQDHFPILGIHKFGSNVQYAAQLQYHKLLGKNVIDKPHKHDFFTFMLFAKGSGMHSIDFTDYKINKQQAHLLFPGQVHCWNLEKNTEAHQLMISGDLFKTLSSSLSFSFTVYNNHPVIDLDADSFSKLLYEVQSIQIELQRKDMSNDIVALRCRLILQLVNREAEKKFADLKAYHAAPLLFEYYNLVDLHFKEQKLVSFYAGRLNISSNYLNILCKKHLYVPAMSFIQKRITLEAKRLLQASDMSVKEIAYELGFNDVAYFSNFFKTHTSLSPRVFRGQE